MRSYRRLMRMVGGFGLSGAIFGVMAGVFAHFASYKPREGVFIVGSKDDLAPLFVRPPWTDLLGWSLAGGLVGVMAGVALYALGFRLVRAGRRSGSDDTTTT